MVDNKALCSPAVEAGSNPILRHISPISSETCSCLPFMKLNKGTTTFGRHPNNDFLIDSSTLKNFISRWHCKIEPFYSAEGKITYRIFDCSLNGTFVNDFRISKEGCVLKNGDKIIFGHLNGSNIKAGSFAPQKNSMFQYAFQDGDNLLHLPKTKNFKYTWSSPCCKKGKKCSAVYKKKLTKYCSPKVKKITSFSKDFKSEQLTKKNHSSPAKSKMTDSSEDTSSQIQQQKISIQRSTDLVFGKYCDSSDNSEGSDTSLLDKVKLSVESFGAIDSDVLDSSDSPNKGF
ncbi:uncharacterized protein LOC118766498 [Octopus sinensis]|nr:uncharacterized protein LOC118766498 [Octopus sinensis]